MEQVQVEARQTEAAARNELRHGALGLGFIIFFVVSAAAPLGVLGGGVPVSMLLGNRAGTPAGFVVVGAILLLFSVGYTKMARHVTNAGAFYAFAARGLGGTAGGAAALIAIVTYNASQIAVYGLFGVATSGLLQNLFGIHLPWWIYAYVVMALIAMLGYRQIDVSAKVLGFFVVGEFIGVFILNLGILKAGGAAGITATSFTPHAFTSGSLTIGILLCFGSYLGFEATTIYAEEARNPERTIPLATYLAVLLIGGFYILSSWCMVVGVGANHVVESVKSLPNPSELMFALSNRYVGGWLTTVLRILFVTSLFAGLLAFHNSVARYFFAMGREGLLPSCLGKTHPRHQSPHIGSVLQTVLAVSVVSIFAIAGSDPVLVLFSWLVNTGTLGVIVLMALASFSVPAFFARNPELQAGTLGTVVLPVFTGICFVVVAVLVVIHFDVLTGVSHTLAVVLPALIPAAAIAGIILALRLSHVDPERFAKLGESNVSSSSPWLT
jgi:amino acid transporter